MVRCGKGYTSMSASGASPAVSRNTLSGAPTCNQDMACAVSIIVINWNTRDMTLACLRSLYAQTHRTDFEVLLVDNGSHDGSAAAIAEEFPLVRLLAETTNHGFAVANNLAIEQARGRRLLLLNSDTVVLDGAVDRLLAFAESRPAARIWGGRTLFGDRSLNITSCWQRQTLWSVVCFAFGLTKLFPGMNFFNPEGLTAWKRDSIREVDIVTGCFLLIDTAGIRKKGKVKEDVEFYSVMRAIRSIENSDVCILMVDAERGFEAQDLNIFHIIDRNHKGVVILVNKWDLIEKQTNTHKQFEEMIREQTAPFRDVPILFASVTHKQRILKAMETAVAVYKSRMRKIPTRELNDFILPVIEQTPPPAVKGKYVRIKYATQLPTVFPSFVFFCNHPQYLKDSYLRFIENKLREHFDFTGVPVEIFFRQK